MSLFTLLEVRKENEKLKADLAALEAKNKELAATAAEAEKLIAEAASKNVQLEADLSTARQTIGTLDNEKQAAVAAKAKADADLKAAQDIIEKPDGEIERKAAIKAAEITAKLGHPPIPGKPAEPGKEPKGDLKGRERFLAATKIPS